MTELTGIYKTELLNIYKKLQKARVLLNESKIQKTGKNAFGTGFKYFELGDFMPQVNEIFNTIGLIGCTDFSPESTATLTITDTDSSQSIVFTCPKADAGLRQGTPIQNVGAQQTYLRRYLWVQAMEITEDDQIDSLASDQKVSSVDTNKQRQKTEAPPAATLPELKERLKGAKDLSTLSAYWTGIPAKYKVQELINYKDACKYDLTPIKQKIMECSTREMLDRVCENITEAEEMENFDLINAKIDEFSIEGKNEPGL